jgi:membrane protease YdiL (CAAX protease family)
MLLLHRQTGPFDMTLSQLIADAAETPAKVDLVDGIYLLGLVILGAWALRSRWGTRAFEHCPSRRNRMPAYTPLVVFLLWFFCTTVSVQVVDALFSSVSQWRLALYRNIVYTAAGVVISAVIMLIGYRFFARRLRGFGLDLRTFPRDLPLAAVNLTAIWPIMMVMLMLTVVVGRLFKGDNYQMAQHEELTLLTDHAQIALKVSVVVVASLVAPVMEELLFRGLFQTALKSNLRHRWAAILLTSILFAGIHTPSHWPTLFALSLCLGYAYEKSGSLLRPIVIHSLFNTVAVASVLFEMSGSAN